MTPTTNRRDGEGRTHAQKTSAHDRWYGVVVAYAYIHSDKIALAAWLAAVLVLEVLA